MGKKLSDEFISNVMNNILLKTYKIDIVDFRVDDSQIKFTFDPLNGICEMGMYNHKTGNFVIRQFNIKGELISVNYDCVRL